MNFVRIIALATIAAITGALAASPTLAQKAAKPASTAKKAKAKPAKAKTAKPKTAKPKTTKAKAPKKSTAKTSTSQPEKTKSTAKTKATKKNKSAKKSPSVCQGLAKSACSANKSCGWVDYKKKVASNGRKLTDHCRLVSGIAKKKAK